MSTVQLQPGDVFCAQGSGPLFAAIRMVQWINSRDNEATYGHAALILDAAGTVLDTRWRVGRTHLDLYQGQQVMIARPVDWVSRCGVISGPISESTKKLCLTAIETTCRGKWYPVHRLFLHLVPPVARLLHIGRWQVCSERVAAYLQAIGARPKPVGGVTPDMLADEWRRWRNFQIIFEGVWE